MAQTTKHVQYKPAYHFPKWHGDSHLDFNVITDEQLAEWETETRECNTHNINEWDKYFAEYIQARDALLRFFGETSNEFKYILTRRPYSSSKPFLSLNEIRRKVEDARFAKRKSVAVAQLEAKKGRAVNWLIARGKTYGVDFALESAIRIADDIAAEEAIDNKIIKMAANPDFVSFIGDNCVGACSGWDGVSKRCDCGNRRVYWGRGDSFSFENPDDLEAEAW